MPANVSNPGGDCGNSWRCCPVAATAACTTSDWLIATTIVALSSLSLLSLVLFLSLHLHVSLCQKRKCTNHKSTRHSLLHAAKRNGNMRATYAKAEKKKYNKAARQCTKSIYPVGSWKGSKKQTKNALSPSLFC